jgi:hypothetical protein
MWLQTVQVVGRFLESDTGESVMPLRDHFHPPLSEIHSWDELHGGWPMVIVQQLGDKLPANYVAVPQVHLGAEAEIDVGAFDQSSERGAHVSPDQGGLATAVWAPAEPTFAVETALADADEYEVRGDDMRRGRRLVAAGQIISPANKDRAENRNQFTAKCAALLRQGVSVVIVDLVTERHLNLYSELLEMIGERDPSVSKPLATYAAACRWHPRGNGRWLEVWNHPLAVGSPLPCPPLWLSEDLALPLDLEASYEKTCRDLRIA